MLFRSHDHEASAEHEQPLVAPLGLVYPSALEDQSSDFEVEHDRDACKNESRVNFSTTCVERDMELKSHRRE